MISAKLKVSQHRLFIDKIKCAKLEIFLKMPTSTFYPEKSAQKMAFLDLLWHSLIQPYRLSETGFHLKNSW